MTQIRTCPCNLSVNTIRLFVSILLVIIVLDLLCVIWTILVVLIPRKSPSLGKLLDQHNQKFELLLNQPLSINLFTFLGGKVAKVGVGGGGDDSV